jgi:hypothetical protein
MSCSCSKISVDIIAVYDRSYSVDNSVQQLNETRSSQGIIFRFSNIYYSIGNQCSRFLSHKL